MQQQNFPSGAAAPKNALRLKESAAKVVKLYDPRTWKEKGLWWTAGLLLLTGAVIMVLVGIYWSRSPGMFDVEQFALEKADGDKTKLVPGYVMTATAIGIGETLLDKPGGYITNDKIPPGLYLDNIKNWEFGALTELRDLVRALRNDFSRSQTQSTEDKDLQLGEPQFHFNSDSWILPSTESAYRDGTKYLYRYLDRLADDQQYDGQFFSRADNLAAYLAVVEKRLGSFALRLAANAGEMRHDIDLAGDPNASKSTATPSETLVKTSWWEIDDIFFESRGYCWALLHTLKAVQVDFKQVLEGKTAEVSLRQIIRALENTQKPVWSPLILNGTGFGPMANHSLVMASYISRANAAIIDLRNLLEQG
ncbi:DUF2333 family protein [Thiorhodovibrio frisius]|uniref:DUF2333 domain-containing protein n=1 Tax=Thiorhodovibrio frisius TaxID=631362 RepID=H8Z224_9GAMM|nr:DUF2333 family protein [Thiorhodovibrio frisius]EIC21549.1 hypothetical protein Thi970DRAFT_01762 [Thiorhodovibrio frisius]WPL24133.1 hypothetical protein Thiofri_04347 [Thiorhodovibrio frisius]